MAIWVRSEFAAIELDTIPCGPYEIIWFSVRLRCGQAAVVAALNRSGSASEGDTRLMEYLDSHRNAVRQQGTHLILAGDFNVHNTDWLGSAKTTPAGEAMEVLSAAHLMVSSTTFISARMLCAVNCGRSCRPKQLVLMVYQEES